MVRDSFSLYHITVLFRPNKQWRVLWKLSICSFLVMTSHQQLTRIFFFSFFFFWCSLCPISSKPDPSPPFWVAFLFVCKRGGQGLREAFSHWVRNKLNFFMDSKHWLDIYDQGQPFWFQLAQALTHTEESINTHAHTHAHRYACMHLAYIHSTTRIWMSVDTSIHVHMHHLWRKCIMFKSVCSRALILNSICIVQ